MKEKNITRNTAISLSMVIVLCGFVWGASALNSSVETNSKTISELKTMQVKYNESIGEIQADIKVIKTKLNRNHR